jgi:tetratricopeptide (TPR) repeat protein
LKEKKTIMNSPARIMAVAAALAGMMFSMSGCRQLEARDQLNKGVDAYKSAHYEEAIGHFQEATRLDPTLPMAKTYLATALAQNVVPGMDTADNVRTANQAIDIFKQVLARDPNDVNSIKQIAGIYYSMASPSNQTAWLQDLQNAKEWQMKVLAVDPKDADAAYTIGVIDWDIAHENLLKALQAAGFNDDGEGNVKVPKKIMEPVAQENAPLVEEGLKYLHMAIADRPNYDNAMSYLNLAYRKKADVDYGHPAEVKDDLAQAQKWSTDALGTRKANEEQKNKAATQGGIVMDQNGNMK